MRGGSSFFGELINRNPEACYWYEAIEAIYHTIYGMLGIWLPLDMFYHRNATRRSIIFYKINSSVFMLKSPVSCHNMISLGTLYPRKTLNSYTIYCRAIPKYEKHHLVENIVNMLNGRLDSLSLTQFVNRFSYVDKALWQKKYGKCQRDHGYQRFNCTYCMDIPSFTELEYCYRNGINEDGSVISWRNVKPSCPQTQGIACFKNCMETLYGGMKKCILLANNAKRKCSQKKISGVKAIRIPMSLVKDILYKDAEIKVVYLVRDPRGIVSSIINTHVPIMQAKVSNKSWYNEINLLCRKIQDDYDSLRKIEEQFPDSVITVKYEDYTQDPLSIARKVYKHIKAPLPIEFQDWLKKSTEGTEKEKNFNTVRKDSSQLAESWRKKVTNTQLKDWTSHCEEVLKHFNYKY